MEQLLYQVTGEHVMGGQSTSDEEKRMIAAEDKYKVGEMNEVEFDEEELSINEGVNVVEGERQTSEPVVKRIVTRECTSKVDEITSSKVNEEMKVLDMLSQIQIGEQLASQLMQQADQSAPTVATKSVHIETEHVHLESKPIISQHEQPLAAQQVHLATRQVHIRALQPIPERPKILSRKPTFPNDAFSKKEQPRVKKNVEDKGGGHHENLSPWQLNHNHTSRQIKVKEGYEGRGIDSGERGKKKARIELVKDGYNV